MFGMRRDSMNMNDYYLESSTYECYFGMRDSMNDILEDNDYELKSRTYDCYFGTRDSMNDILEDIEDAE